MNKIYLFFTKVVLLIPAAFLVLLIRLLKPFFVVRLGGLDIGRIGGVIIIDWYLAECYAGKHNKKYYDVFYLTSSTGKISNRAWLKIVGRSCRIFKFFKLGQLVYKINQRLPGAQEHLIPSYDAVPFYNKEYIGRDTAQCVLNHSQPAFKFTAQEESYGQKGLNELGVSKDSLFVCFHARDSAYLNSFSNKDWSYHDFRDSNIDNYLPAAEILAQRGYYCLRVGSIAEKAIHSIHPRVIDYTTSGKRTELLDIYLGAKCHFFICSDTGMSLFPEMFRRPVVYVNWAPLLRVPYFYILSGLIIPKKFYLRREQRFLTFKEIIDSEFGSISRAEILEKLDIELIENTPEEITAVALEMDERIKGTWKTTAEDEELQERFWTLFDPYQIKNPGVRIGADFLRQNQQILNIRTLQTLR